MRGLLIEPDGVAYRDDLPAPSPGPGEVIVRVHAAGVCATDLALARGYMGFSGVPGHEFVGQAATGRLAGRRVVGEINAGCGCCDRCRSGLARHCAERSVLGILGRAGAFAEEIALPEENLHAVPDEVSDDGAVFAEPLAAAFEILDQVPVGSGTRVLVAGDGRLGLLCAWVLHLAGAEVTISGHHPERHDLHPPGAGFEDPRGGRPGERDQDLAVEATGSEAALTGLFGRVRPRGTIVLKTTIERPLALDLAPVVIDELTLVGSRCGRMAPALAALAEGAIPIERWISERHPLERGPLAFERAAAPDVLKVLVDVGAG